MSDRTVPATEAGDAGGSGDAGSASAREVLAAVTDPGTFAEHTAPPASEPHPEDGPIGWSGYDQQLAAARERTGEAESVVVGTARISGAEAVLLAFDFRFLGGSIGAHTGARLEAAHSLARERRLPLVSLVATGGSRMQEGMRALSQLHRTARQTALTRAAGIPQIAVLRDPTTGGGWATLGTGADVALALPDAQVGFAGARVRPPGADPAAYTAPSQLAAGCVDALVPPEALRTTLARWLRLLRAAPASAGPVAPAPVPAALGLTTLPGRGREAVSRARSPHRPRAVTYLDAYFSEREQLSGDRCGGTDPGVLCGFGLHRDRTVAYAAQCGTPTLPAGYRTAARLVRVAGRLAVPVLTLVDTPGADNGPDAERAGAGAAIADLFDAIATAPVPVTTLVIGEGGSGGALALASPEALWLAPDAYFSVIAPESAASILKYPAEEAPAVADRLRPRPQDLVELGIAHGIASAEGAPPHGAG
jgi:acetyl-CoA carboxylase beta subunit